MTPEERRAVLDAVELARELGDPRLLPIVEAFDTLCAEMVAASARFEQALGVIERVEPCVKRRPAFARRVFGAVGRGRR